MIRPAHLLTCLAVTGLLLAAAPCAQGWAAGPAAAKPPGRGAAALAFDSVRGVAVLYGGSQLQRSPPPLLLRDTWEYDGTTWRQNVTAGSPGDRLYAAMAFDPLRRRMVLFGGFHPTTNTWLDDTWEYDGVSWRATTPASPPSPRRTTLAWDPQRGRVVAHGGNADHDPRMAPFFDDTWQYDGVSWSPIVSATRPPAGPPVALCFDAGRGLLVALVYDAQGAPPQTWELAAGGWTRRIVARDPVAGIGTMVHDPVRGVCVHFDTTSARQFSSRVVPATWEYDGSTWHETTTSQRPGLAFRYTALAWHAPLGATLCFGGEPNSFPGSSSDTTWVYTPPSRYGVYVPFGIGCAGSRGVVQWTTTTVPYAGRSLQGWLDNLATAAPTAFLFGGSDQQWGGVNLPLDLSPFGFTGCGLLVSPDVILNLTPGFGATFVDLPLPPTPSLAGVRFFNQAVTLDAAAPNGLGAVSNGGRGVVGR